MKGDLAERILRLAHLEHMPIEAYEYTPNFDAYLAPIPPRPVCEHGAKRPARYPAVFYCPTCGHLELKP